MLRQNSMRTENSAILCREGCLIQVIPSRSNAMNLSRGTRTDHRFGRDHNEGLLPSGPKSTNGDPEELVEQV